MPSHFIDTKNTRSDGHRSRNLTMYVLVTHIPILTSGTECYVDASWHRDLMLARDWLAAPFGQLKLVSPSMPLSARRSDVMSVERIDNVPGITVLPSIDARSSARKFWLHQRSTWLKDVNHALDGATVLHTADWDIFKPITFMAHAAAVSREIPTVFIGPDMDPHVTLPRSLRSRIYLAMFDGFMRRAARDTRLLLLKEGLVYDRYAKYNDSTRAICHSMHSRDDVVEEQRLAARLATLQQQRPLKAVYAGRFVPRKGVNHAIAAIALAKRQGHRVEYHLFGGGPEEANLRQQVNDLDVDDLVFFHGFVEYGSAFMAKLAEFDIFLFMPTEEDTPRALYDTMAAGLPFVGTAIPFMKKRLETDRAGIPVKVLDVQGAAEQLARLSETRGALIELSHLAREAGLRHSVEQWYRRRAEWTIAAVAGAAAKRKSLGMP